MEGTDAVESLRYLFELENGLESGSGVFAFHPISGCYVSPCFPGLNELVSFHIRDGVMNLDMCGFDVGVQQTFGKSSNIWAK